MPEKEDFTQAVYRTARALLPEMKPKLRRPIEDLLEQAERGLKTDNRIVELVSADPVLRPKLRGLLEESESEQVLTAGYFSPPGDVFSTPKRPLRAPKFVCPECEFTRRIQKAGQDPGLCPVHGLRLIPLAEKKEGR